MTSFKRYLRVRFQVLDTFSDVINHFDDDAQGNMSAEFACVMLGAEKKSDEFKIFQLQVAT